MNTTTPKFANGHTIRGKEFGTFVVYGSRWSEVLGEWVYEVRQLGPAGQQSHAMNLVESCFA